MEEEEKSRQRLWNELEIELLYTLFSQIKLNNGKNGKASKTKIIQKRLSEIGFERTEKSIRRKLFRMDLVDFRVDNKVNSKCSVCGTPIRLNKRYLKMYDNRYCVKCEKVKKGAWNKTEQGKAYQREYRKKNKDKLAQQKKR